MIIDTLTTNAWKCGETQKITCQNGKSNSVWSIGISVVVIIVELLVMLKEFSASHMSTFRTFRYFKAANELCGHLKMSTVDVLFKISYSADLITFLTSNFSCAIIKWLVSWDKEHSNKRTYEWNHASNITSDHSFCIDSWRKHPKKKCHSRHASETTF